MSKDNNEIHKSDSVSVLLYHVVCTIKYRCMVIDEDVDRIMLDVCCEIALHYDIHFLIQSVPDYSIQR